MGVCLVTGGKSHYSGLYGFGVQDVKATILAYAGLRVKQPQYQCTVPLICINQTDDKSFNLCQLKFRQLLWCNNDFKMN